MTLLDTCAIVYDALAPERLGRAAAREIEKGRTTGRLACSDISLWEIGMLVAEGRLRPDADPLDFLRNVVAANRLAVLPVSPEIAVTATTHPEFAHGDPADRIIAATAMVHRATLLTCDDRLRAVPGLKTVW